MRKNEFPVSCWLVLFLAFPVVAQEGPKKDAPAKGATEQAPDKWKPGLQMKVPTSEGFDIGLFIPDAYAQQPARKFPILFMHDPGGNPAPAEFKDWANGMSVILVGVNGAENGPNEPIIARQNAAIAFVEKELRISNCLRFSMGMSGAAMMSWLMCINHSEKHAGILMMGQAGFPELPPPHVAVAYIHGDTEPNLPFIKSAIKRLRKAGNPMRQLELPGGHIAGGHSDQVEMLTWMVNLERFTHPKRSLEEIKEAKADTVKRIEALDTVTDPSARVRDAEALLTIPDVGKWPEGKTLASVWFKAAMETAGAMNVAAAKHEFLMDLANSAHLKLVPPAESKTLTQLLADLRKDPAIRKEYDADRMLQLIKVSEEQAKTKSAWQQIGNGYATLKARFPGTRAAAAAEGGIKRAEEKINPPR